MVRLLGEDGTATECVTDHDWVDGDKRSGGEHGCGKKLNSHHPQNDGHLHRGDGCERIRKIKER